MPTTIASRAGSLSCEFGLNRSLRFLAGLDSPLSPATMERAEAIFLGVWFPGLLLLIAGVFLTRRFWRSDVLPYQYQPLSVRGFDILVHPGRYTYPPAARIIRILNLAGALLLGIGLAALVYGIVHSIRAH